MSVYLDLITETIKKNNYYYIKDLKINKEKSYIIEFRFEKRISKKFREYLSDNITKILIEEDYCYVHLKENDNSIHEFCDILSFFAWAPTGW